MQNNDIPLRPNGHIDQKRLFKMLYNEKSIRKVKPKRKLTAQYTNLSNVNNNVERFIKKYYEQLEVWKVTDPYLARIIIVLFTYGLRVSEVLNIKYTDINQLGHINIKSLKGSQNRIIIISELNKYLLSCRWNGNNPFDLYNRFFVYRKLKSVGLFFRGTEKEKNSVTHSFRHVLINRLRNNGTPDEEIAKFIGHKRLTNTINYGR